MTIIYSESIGRAISILEGVGEKIGMGLGSNVASQESRLPEDALVGLTRVKGRLCGSHSLIDVETDVASLGSSSTKNVDGPH